LLYRLKFDLQLTAILQDVWTGNSKLCSFTPRHCDGLEVSDSRMGNVAPRYNGAPSQELLGRTTIRADGFFEWRAIKGARAKQPYAIAMKDGSPFGLAGVWENWKNPKTGEWKRTFAGHHGAVEQVGGPNP
jgi:hypothetical protein